MAETRKVHAEEKEEEVKLLERSVEELECTINVLENKVKGYVTLTFKCIKSVSFFFVFYLTFVTWILHFFVD